MTSVVWKMKSYKCRLREYKDPEEVSTDHPRGSSASHRKSNAAEMK